MKEYTIMEKGEKMYGYLMQDNFTAHKGNLSKTAPDRVFGEGLITDVVWPPGTQGLNRCNYYVQGTERILCEQSTLFRRTEDQFLKTNAHISRRRSSVVR
jgi:hypothetical protein